jgi:hypothetical protein
MNADACCVLGRSGKGSRPTSTRTTRMEPIEEITYLPEVECEIFKENGLLGTQIVGVPDEGGNKQFLRVGKGFVQKHAGRTYLPVGIVEVRVRERRALVELPYEADSGISRLWISFDNFRQAE